MAYLKSANHATAATADAPDIALRNPAVPRLSGREVGRGHHDTSDEFQSGIAGLDERQRSPAIRT